jgi:crooked neck
LELPHQPERARKLVENALTILPRYEKQSWSILLCTYGRAFALLEDYDKASQAFQKSLRMSPNNWETHVLYADSVLVPNEAIEEARRHYKVALQLAPGKKKSRVQSKMPPSQVVPRPVT